MKKEDLVEFIPMGVSIVSKKADKLTKPVEKSAAVAEAGNEVAAIILSRYLQDLADKGIHLELTNKNKSHHIKLLYQLFELEKGESITSIIDNYTKILCSHLKSKDI